MTYNLEKGNLRKARGKKEVTNNEVKIPEKAKKIWMAVKKKWKKKK